jgi:hypothetical protein
MSNRHLAVSIFTAVLILASLPLASAGAHPTQQPQPTPEGLGDVDRLAIPVLPDNPTQLDVGKSLYYYHCMPCHGDYGQGLTDEFRSIWVEDHQNCWARGCHSGRPGEEGFPIPKVIPAVNETAASEAMFPTRNDLFAYLKATHPPQYPGKLKDEEYRALSAFVYMLAGREEAASQAGLSSPTRSSWAEIGLGVVLLGALFVVASLFRRE